jgi:hypothetical protein
MSNIVVDDKHLSLATSVKLVAMDMSAQGLPFHGQTPRSAWPELLFTCSRSPLKSRRSRSFRASGPRATTRKPLFAHVEESALHPRPRGLAQHDV